MMLLKQLRILANRSDFWPDAAAQKTVHSLPSIDTFRANYLKAGATVKSLKFDTLCIENKKM